MRKKQCIRLLVLCLFFLNLCIRTPQIYAADQDFFIDTKAGMMAVYKEAPRSEHIGDGFLNVWVPQQIIQFFDRTLHAFAVIGRQGSNNQPVVDAHNHNRPAEEDFYNTVPALLPFELQKDLKAPTGTDNELKLQIPGKTCSDSTGNQSEAPNATLQVSAPYKNDYYLHLAGQAALGAIWGTIQYKDKDGYVGNGVPSLSFQSRKNEPGAEYYKPSADGKSFILTDTSVLPPCRTTDPSERAPDQELPIYGSINQSTIDYHRDTSQPPRDQMGDILAGIIRCLLEGECPVFDTMGVGMEYRVISPGTPALAGLVRGGFTAKSQKELTEAVGENLPPATKKQAVLNEATTEYKGTMNTFISKDLADSVNKIPNGRAKVDQSIVVTSTTEEGEQSQNGKSPVPIEGTKATNDYVRYVRDCVLMPLSLLQNVAQDREEVERVSCSEKESKPQTCDPEYFKQFNLEDSRQGAQSNIQYTIPYRSTSCTLDEGMIDPIANFAQSYTANGTQAAANIKAEWEKIQEKSQEYKWNPLFVLAIWIEESGAGAHPNAGWHLGCKYGMQSDNNWTKQMPKIGEAEGDICSQMACMFSHPVKNPDDFGGFMCSYDTAAMVNRACPAYSGWGFAQRTLIIYQRLLKDTGQSILGGNCGFTSIQTPNVLPVSI